MIPAPSLVRLSVAALNRTLREAPAGETPTAEGWLGPRERATYRSLRVPKRRREWLAGRLAAKEVVRRRHFLDCSAAALDAIEIDSVPAGPERGRPTYRLHDRPAPFGLSISHSGDHALAALSRCAGEKVGIDVEAPAAFDPSAESLLLAPAETRRLRGLLRDDRRRALTWIWVLKEALVKALGTGLRVALPDIEVSGDPWSGGMSHPAFHGTFLLGGEVVDLVRLSLSARTFLVNDAPAAWVVLGADPGA